MLLFLNTAIFAQAGNKFNITFGGESVEAELIKVDGKKTFIYTVNPNKDQWNIQLLEANTTGSAENRKMSISHKESGTVITVIPFAYNNEKELEILLNFKDYKKQMRSLSKKSNSFYIKEIYEGSEGLAESIMVEFKLQK